jgi:raffinose/stachyose/melibiose transport system permease protein
VSLSLSVRRRTSRWLPGFVMTAPAVALFAAFIVVPLGLAFYLSLTDWNGFSSDPGFVGADNYRDLLDNPRVKSAAMFTLLIAVAGTILCNALGLGFAVLIGRPSRVNAFFRTLMFFPHIISALIIGFLWSALLSSTGVINELISGLGAAPLPFLADPGNAKIAVIFVIVWATFGVNLVLYIAGLQSIPPEYYEAATIDGAGPWHQLRHITLPMIAPVMTVNLVITLVWMLKTYDLVVGLTGGGPAGRTQTVVFLIIFDSFQNGKLGSGAAQAVILMIITAVLGIGVALFRRGAEQKVSA